MSDKPAKRALVDWEAVERDYRTGMLSLSELSTLHKVAKSRICVVAKKLEWTQDLSARIKAKAAAKVNDAAVNAVVNAQRKVSDAEKVEIGATVLARVLIGQKQDITRSRSLAMRLLGELEAQTDNQGLFEQLGELLHSPDERGQDKRNEIYSKVISFTGRTKSMKELTDTLKTLVALEREAFGLNDGPEDEAAKTKTMTDAERASRLASILTRAKASADAADD